jgi:DnaK suppressor protein
MSAPADNTAPDGAALAAELAARRRHLEVELNRLTAPRTEAEAPIGFGKRAGDFTAMATDSTERAVIAERLSEQLVGVQRAAAKLADGSYGHCDGCGQPIGAERLGALPAALLCLDCTSTATRGHRR